MWLLIQMHLLSDAIFGNGMSMPGGEDICVQTDQDGFPYLKGSTIKGIFREELINYLSWQQKPEDEIRAAVRAMMGESGSDELDDPRKLNFSDLTVHPEVRRRILEEGGVTPQDIRSMFTYARTFTSLEDGVAREGSLRTARCIKKGLHFYGECTCHPEDQKTVEQVLGLIKGVGTMRTRGFGKVQIKSEELG